MIKDADEEDDRKFNSETLYDLTQQRNEQKLAKKKKEEEAALKKEKEEAAKKKQKA